MNAHPSRSFRAYKCSEHAPPVQLTANTETLQRCQSTMKLWWGANLGGWGETTSLSCMSQLHAGRRTYRSTGPCTLNLELGVSGQPPTLTALLLGAAPASRWIGSYDLIWTVVNRNISAPVKDQTLSSGHPACSSRERIKTWTEMF
jgi:hypothetical protein